LVNRRRHQDDADFEKSGTGRRLARDFVQNRLFKPSGYSVGSKLQGFALGDFREPNMLVIGVVEDVGAIRMPDRISPCTPVLGMFLCF